MLALLVALLSAGNSIYYLATDNPLAGTLWALSAAVWGISAVADAPPIRIPGLTAAWEWVRDTLETGWHKLRDIIARKKAR